MKRAISRLLRLTMVVSAAVSLSSCLTVKGNLTQPVEDLKFTEPLVDSGLVYIETEFYRLAEGLISNPVFVPAQTDNFRDQVAQVTMESSPFAKYSFDPAVKDEADLIVHLEVLHTYNNTTSMFAMGVTIVTLGIIPTAIKDNYELVITVKDQDGREIHKKQYQDFTRTWLHLIFLPFVGTMNKNTNKVLSNMVKASYKNLQFNEALLAGPYP